MHGFIIAPANRPGSLASVLEAIAASGVNVASAGGATWDGSGAVAIATSDDAATRSALDAAGASYREVDLVMVDLDDRPGTLADAARRLGNAGVNIEAVFAAGMSGTKVTVAFGVDNLAAARTALGMG